MDLPDAEKQVAERERELAVARTELATSDALLVTARQALLDDPSDENVSLVLAAQTARDRVLITVTAREKRLEDAHRALAAVKREVDLASLSDAEHRASASYLLEQMRSEVDSLTELERKACEHIATIQRLVIEQQARARLAAQLAPPLGALPRSRPIELAVVRGVVQLAIGQARRQEDRRHTEPAALWLTAAREPLSNDATETATTLRRALSILRSRGAS